MVAVELKRDRRTTINKQFISSHESSTHVLRHNEWIAFTAYPTSLQRFTETPGLIHALSFQTFFGVTGFRGGMARPGIAKKRDPSMLRIAGGLRATGNDSSQALFRRCRRLEVFTVR